MKRYHNQDAETENVLKYIEGEEEIFSHRLHSGDIGYMDSQGYFFIVDRKKEMILSGGYNIYPRNVEEVIYMHKAVKECAVIGIPHKMRGQVVKAFIVLKDKEQLSAQEMKDFMRDKISLYSLPNKIEFRTDLPKSIIGKILKKELVAEENKKL